ncbi:MAG: hypothetical protein KAX59_04255, partial [Acidovorax sp.]|nr:hypothetical protein [Acidovorax sp.]
MRVIVSGMLYFNSQIGIQRLFYMRIQLSFWERISHLADALAQPGRCGRMLRARMPQLVVA